MNRQSPAYTIADELIDWLASVDWLTTGAFLLTIGAFLGAVLDSYTSLCVVGGDLAHIGQAASCPDVQGWDTRTFPLAVDMGWGGALLSTIKLARSIGLGNWRWWAVLGFEVLVASTTVAGNAVHGAVVAGSANHLLQSHPTAIAGIASAVPGVVAVGAGFTLSALISTRHAREATTARLEAQAAALVAPSVGQAAALAAPPAASSSGHDGDTPETGDRMPDDPSHDTPDDTVDDHLGDAAADAVRSSRDERGDVGQDASMTAEEAQAVVLRLVRRRRGRGRAVTVEEVTEATGRKRRQAQRLLTRARAELDTDDTSPARRPRVFPLSPQQSIAAAPAAAAPVDEEVG